MRIALLSYEYPPDTGFGGIGTYTFYQAHALARLGHEVTVYAGAQKPTRAEVDDGPVRVVRSWKPNRAGALLPLDDKELPWLGNRLDAALNMFAAIRRDLPESRYDVVEMPECGAEGALVNSMLDLPTVVRLHSPAELIMPTYETRRLDRALTAMVERVGISSATAITSCSRWLARQVSERMGIRRPITVIPNGIDLQTFDVDEGFDIHDRWDLERGTTKVFFANRLEPRKGIQIVRDICVPILKKFDDVVFVVAGADLDDWMGREIRPLLAADGLTDRVVALGRITLSEVRACLKQTDIYLLPSTWENAPYSLLEAMAAGKPVLASNCGGIPEVLRHGTDGLLAETGDAASFELGLAKLLSNAKMRNRLGAAARQRVESRFDDRRMAEHSLEFYRWALDAPTATSSSAQARCDSDAAIDGSRPGAVGPTDWFQVPWLSGQPGGSKPAVFDSQGTAPLAQLDLDELAFVTQILVKSFWDSAHRDDSATAKFIEELQAFGVEQAQARTDHWRPPSDSHLSLPALSHHVFTEEEILQHFANEFWRLEAEPWIAAWISRCAATPGFVELAHRSISVRRMLLRIAVRKPSQPILDALRALYRAPAKRSELLEEDREFGSTGHAGRSYAADIAQLGLHAPLRRPQVFGRAAARPRQRQDGEPDVTVVIPSYRHENFIADAIRSVLEQDSAACAVLVADDASPDNTVATANAIDDPRLTVTVNPSNLGLGRSIARALESVDTEFVAILNSDDLFHPDRIARCLETLRANPDTAVAATGLEVMDSKSCRLEPDTSCITDIGPRAMQWLRWYEERCTPRLARDERNPDTDLFRDLLAANFLVTSSNLVCRTAWLSARTQDFVPLRYCLDWRIFLEAAQTGALAVVEEPLLGYRLHDSNTVWFEGDTKADYVHEVNFVLAEVLRRHVDYLEERGQSPEAIAERIADLMDGPVQEHGESDGTEIAWSLLTGRPTKLDYAPETAHHQLAAAAMARKQRDESLGGSELPAWVLAERVRRHPHFAAAEHLARGLLAQQRPREREAAWLRKSLEEAQGVKSDETTQLKLLQKTELQLREASQRVRDLEQVTAKHERLAAELEQLTTRHAEVSKSAELRTEEAAGLRRRLTDTEERAEAAESDRDAARKETERLRDCIAELESQRLQLAKANASRNLDNQRRARRRLVSIADPAQARLAGVSDNLGRSTRFAIRKLRRPSETRTVMPLPDPAAWINQPCLLQDLGAALEAGIDLRFVFLPVANPDLDRKTPDFVANLARPAAWSPQAMTKDRASFEQQHESIGSSTTWQDVETLVEAIGLGSAAFSIVQECRSLQPTAILATNLDQQGLLAALTAILLDVPLVLRLRGRDLTRGPSSDVMPDLVLGHSAAVVADSPSASTAAAARAGSAQHHAAIAPQQLPTRAVHSPEGIVVAAFGPTLRATNPRQTGEVFAAIRARYPEAKLIVATPNSLTTEEVRQREDLIHTLAHHGAFDAVEFRDGIGSGRSNELAASAAMIIETAMDGTDLGVPDGAVLATAHGTPVLATRTPSLTWYKQQNKSPDTVVLAANDSLAERAITILDDLGESRPTAGQEDLRLTEWRALATAIGSWRTRNGT